MRISPLWQEGPLVHPAGQVAPHAVSTPGIGFANTNLVDFVAAPASLPPQPRLELKNLFNIATWQDAIPWTPFHEGVDIHRLYGDGLSGPSAALIRFRQAGKVPRHEHVGYEHIIVLVGSQRDQTSNATAGTLLINPPGGTHSVVSEAGCIVLAIYEKAVRFLPSSP